MTLFLLADFNLVVGWSIRQTAKFNPPPIIEVFSKNAFHMHSKMLRIIHLHCYSSLPVVCGSGIKLENLTMCGQTAPMRLLITSCCASLCHASQLILHVCSCSLTHIATAIWSILTADHTHFCIL